MPPTTSALYTPREVFEAPRVRTWALLAFSAGAVNAGAFLAVQRFVSHVTGSATRVGLDVSRPALMGDYLLVLVCFVAGAAASALAIDGRLHAGKTPLHALPLAVVSAMLALVAAVGNLGLFGPFGQTVETAPDFALLCVLSFAMGLQNAAVAISTGMVVRSTHMTGPATDLGVAIAAILYASGEAREAALRSARLRGAKLAGFILGAGAMAPLAARAGYLAFLLPAALSLVAASRFAPSLTLSALPLRTSDAR